MTPTAPPGAAERAGSLAGRHWSAVCALASLLAVVYLTSHVTDARITSDPVDTVKMAVNLAHHGVISDDSTADPKPGMYREPLPAASAAAAVVVSDALWGHADASSYLSGSRARILKYQNVLWKAIASAAAYAILLALTGLRPLALLGAVLVVIRQPAVDTLFSEPIAAALLTLGSTVLAAGMRKQNALALLLAGVCFGLLTLTKAIFLYVFIALLAVIAVLELLRREPPRPRSLVRGLAALAVGFSLITLPWMLRNYIEFGTLRIAERGGVGLYQRALEDQMTWEEYRGSFYYPIDPRLTRLLGAMTGFEPRDLQRGGRLQRLAGHVPGVPLTESDRAAEAAGRPDLAVTFFRQSRAERVRLESAYQAGGYPFANLAADTALTKRAVAMILVHPFRHLALSIPFMWEAAPTAFPILLITGVYALRSARRDLLHFVLPALGMLLMYALFVVSEVRYAVPTYPLELVSVIVLLLAVSGRLRSTAAVSRQLP